MMPDHGANPVFLIKKKDWTSRTLTNPPLPTSDNISFLPYSPTPLPPPLKVDVICISPLIVLYNVKLVSKQRKFVIFAVTPCHNTVSNRAWLKCGKYYSLVRMKCKIFWVSGKMKFHLTSAIFVAKLYFWPFRNWFGTDKWNLNSEMFLFLGYFQYSYLVEHLWEDSTGNQMRSGTF